MGRASARVTERCLDAVKTYGMSPIKFIAIINTNKDATSARGEPGKGLDVFTSKLKALVALCRVRSLGQEAPQKYDGTTTIRPTTSQWAPRGAVDGSKTEKRLFIR